MALRKFIMIMLIYLNTAFIVFFHDIYIKGTNVINGNNIINYMGIFIYIGMNLISFYIAIKKLNSITYQIIIAYNIVVIGISYYYDYEIKKGTISVVTFSIVAILLFNIYSYYRLSKIKD
jgi:hypothetical protein